MRQGEPLDPVAERIFEMRSGNKAIKAETHLCQKSDRGAVGWFIAAS